MADPILTDQSLSTDYYEEDKQLRIRRNKIACLLGAILMPIGGFLDNMLYPDLLQEFIVIRAITVLLVGAIFVSHNTSFGKAHVKWLGVLLILMLNLSFCTMMYLSDGVLSRFHMALSLMILGSGILLPWTVMETLIVSIITLSMYITSCLLHGIYLDPIEDWDIFFNNGYFILLSGIIAVTSSYFNTAARKSDFILRHELDIRNRKLEEIDRLKSRFFANISHELRTPLTLILSPIQDLLQLSSSSDNKTNNLLKTAHDNALRLLRLVNELLEVIKLEEGKVKYEGEPVVVEDFLAAMADSMMHLAESQHITLTKRLCLQPNIIIADSYMLERIFINLLGNAIKFTPSGGSITISDEVLDNEVHIRISDTGIGISEEDLPYIFDRFHQAGNSSTHRSQGTGLGLALVKELTEIMNGKIDVTSKLGSGTTMHISFPLSSQISSELTGNEQSAPYHGVPADTVKDEKDNPSSAKAPVIIPDMVLPAGDGPLILVVDDEPDMRNYLVNALAKKYRVIQAQDGEQALKLAEKFNPDFILLDLMLPKIDGLVVCKTLKQNHETRHIKIMMLTARIDEEAKITALEYGADDFLTKPFSKIEVQTRLRNLLQTANLENSLKLHNRELEHALSVLKQTQSQLIHSEKINALGKLTAGLLHEINNPLNYALTAMQILKHEPAIKSDEAVNETIQDIDEGMSRIKTIISDLQIFAHPSESSKQESFHLQDAIKSALRFTANEIGNIDVRLQTQQTDVVTGSRGSIVQVFINLLTNACKAIHSAQEQKQGVITIRTERVESRLHIFVHDNGIGIEKSIMANIFDPFFTSRDVGEGMGLGLSICHTIVNNHGGKLSVDSNYGKWTEFSFDLPFAQSESEYENGFRLHAIK